MQMMRLPTALPAAFLMVCLSCLPAPSAPVADGPEPVKALLVCGGCCHDYEHQKHILAESLAKRAWIDVTVVHQGGTSKDSKIPLYEDAGWAKGYDIVIHDECFSGVGDKDFVNTILKPHAEGLPAVVLHCSMHTYRTGDDRWFEFLGVTSRRHGKAYGHEVLNVDASHPIMKDWGPAWQNPQGELYWIEKVWPSAHPLATSKNQENGHDEICVWTNQYKKARVFGTTLGHHNETVSDPKYLELLTNGVLWACGKLEPEYLKADGGPREAPADRARREREALQDVKVPEGYDATLFAEPPAANYPVFVAASPDGTLYVSSDKNGSLDREPLRGSVLRLRDLDGDGRADEVKRFVANVDSPRGLVFDHDRVYLMHPPHLSAFIDDDGDGVADREEVLVKNIAFGFEDRPADHTSNGVTLGIDGWLYLAIGDFGFMHAEGADGRTLQLRGGGVVRVRPDGTGLELYSRGTRNILEVGLDGLLNGFARDNTNDGGGWDTRLHHFSGGEHHGYPFLFKNFADEAVAPLADYGGGSGCGSLFLDEPGFPSSDSPALYTADWGRESVFRHHLTPSGATFSADQSEFIRLPRVTDLDVDASSHLYLSSWKGAKFTYVGENVGYLVRLTPKGAKPAPLPDFDRLDAEALVSLLSDPSHRRRLEAQRALLRRGLVKKARRSLEKLALDRSGPLTSRVAALFALKQGLGKDSTRFLYRATADSTIIEYAYRALADRPEEGTEVATVLFSDAVPHANPRARLQIVLALARLGRTEAAEAIASRMADVDPVVAHTAVQALVGLDASDACFAVLDRDGVPRTKGHAQVIDSLRVRDDAPEAARAGALMALERMHDARVVDGLISRLESETRPARRLGLESALARLAHREGTWTGDSWGTRPDTSGPYYQPEEWSETGKITAALRQALGQAKGDEAAGLVAALSSNKVDLGISLDRVLKMARSDPALVPAAVAQLAESASVPTESVPLLVSAASAGTDAVRSHAVQALARTPGSQAARAMLEALVFLSEGKKKNQVEYQRARQAFLESGLLGENVDVWKSAAQEGDSPLAIWADAALLEVVSAGTSSPEARDAAAKAVEAARKSKPRQLRMLEAIALSGDRRLAEHVRVALVGTDPQVQRAARKAARSLKIPLEPRKPHTGPKIEDLPAESVIAEVVGLKGDPSEGEFLFTSLSCVNCHTVSQDEPAKGPYLGTIAATYKRPELAEAVLRPSKTLAQGFVTNIFALDDGRTFTGFVTREAADSVTIRTSDAKEVVVPTSQIEQRAQSETSVMPEGLVNGITVEELASLLDYLEGLSAEK